MINKIIKANSNSKKLSERENLLSDDLTQLIITGIESDKDFISILDSIDTYKFPLIDGYEENPPITKETIAALYKIKQNYPNISLHININIDNLINKLKDFLGSDESKKISLLDSDTAKDLYEIDRYIWIDIYNLEPVIIEQLEDIYNSNIPSELPELEQLKKIEQYKKKRQSKHYTREPLSKLAVIFKKFFTALYDNGTALIHEREPYQILVFDITKTHVVDFLDTLVSKGVNPNTRYPLSMSTYKHEANSQKVIDNAIKYLNYGIKNKLVLPDTFFKSIASSYNMYNKFMTKELVDALKEYDKMLDNNGYEKSAEFIFVANHMAGLDID